MKTYGGSGDIAPRILNLSAKRKWGVSRKIPRHPLDRKLGGPQMRSGHV